MAAGPLEDRVRSKAKEGAVKGTTVDYFMETQSCTWKNGDLEMWEGKVKWGLVKNGVKYEEESDGRRRWKEFMGQKSHRR